jgi:glycosyltransferase involved in cell wall biosynthesis
MEPRVTILLPTHNRADVLGYAIRSALWQTEKDFELLIVGDGCTDDTARVVAGFDDARIRWFDLPKAPLSGYANRNIALRAARGRYVAYAQHDDIWFPDHLERLTAALETSGAEWGYSRPLWVMPDGVMLPYSVDLTHDNELAHFTSVENAIPSSCVMHERQALVRVGYWPEDVPRVADWHCWRRILATGQTHAIGYCAMPTALHFRARWRQGDHPLERRLRAIADATWWPEACRVSVQPGDVEQTRFFDALSPMPSAWIDHVRAAVDGVAVRLAWSGAVAFDSELRALESQSRSRSWLWGQLLGTILRKSRRR